MSDTTAPEKNNGAKRLPQRDEIPEHLKWKLEDLFPTDEAWEKEFAEVQALIGQAESHRGKVGESAAALLAAMKLEEQVRKGVERLAGYALMRRDEANHVPLYQGMAQRAIGLHAQAGSAFSFLTPELLALSKATIDAYLEQEEELKIYRHALDDLFRQKPHVLSPREEQILAEVGEMAYGVHATFNMLNHADMKFGTLRDEEGEEVELTSGRYIQFMRSHDRRVRQDAFQLLYKQYSAYKNTLASIYSTSVKGDIFFARTRRHPSALAAALNPDNVPISVYDNLIAAVREGLPYLHRYMDLRKKLLGVDELHMYDLYAPLIQGVDFKLPYEEAQKTVKDGLLPLGADYQAALDEAFANRWIDALENEGKSSGAYVRDVHGVHPYVLLNYQGNIDDLFTLAHEMGHAIHSYFTQKSQPYVYADYTIFVAEVASTVNEALLVNYMLDRESDPRRRLYILNYYLEQFRGVVYRQVKFAEFEKIVHERAEAGDAITAQTLSDIYRGLNEAYYGPNVRIDPEIDVEWARIPHFYSAFYVYKYATGFAAANAIAQAILSGKQGAVERYLDFLSSGGSDYPLNLLRSAGVDMSSPQPIQEALALFDSLLDETEALALQHGSGKGG